MVRSDDGHQPLPDLAGVARWRRQPPPSYARPRRWIAPLLPRRSAPGVLLGAGRSTGAAARAAHGGGEPLALGPFEDGCEQPVWLPDSSGVVVVAPLRPAA